MKRLLSMVLIMGTIESMSGAVIGHTGKHFTVTESDRSYKVGRESIDNTLRNVHASNIAAFLRRGRITAHKTSDGSYMLRGHVNGLGGGPVCASFAYWATKVLCYGTAAAATGAVVASGVGAIAGAAGIGAGAAAGAGTLAAGVAEVGAIAAAEGAGILASGTLVGGGTVFAMGAPTGVGLAGATIASAGGTATATALTGGTIAATAGTTLGTVGWIEGLALTMASLGATPLLP